MYCPDTSYKDARYLVGGSVVHGDTFRFRILMASLSFKKPPCISIAQTEHDLLEERVTPVSLPAPMYNGNNPSCFIVSSYNMITGNLLWLTVEKIAPVYEHMHDESHNPAIRSSTRTRLSRLLSLDHAVVYIYMNLVDPAWHVQSECLFRTAPATIIAMIVSRVLPSTMCVTQLVCSFLQTPGFHCIGTTNTMLLKRKRCGSTMISCM